MVNLSNQTSQSRVSANNGYITVWCPAEFCCCCYIWRLKLWTPGTNLMRMISNLTLLSSSSEMELASSTAGITSIKSSCNNPGYVFFSTKEEKKYANWSTWSRAMSLLLPLWPSTFGNHILRYHSGILYLEISSGMKLYLKIILGKTFYHIIRNKIIYQDIIEDIIMFYDIIWKITIF